MFAFQSKQKPAPTQSIPQSTLPTWTINRPGDSYEQEADRAAEQVMRATRHGASAPILSTYAPGLQRACDCGGTCSDCQAGKHDHEHSTLQLKAADAGPRALQAPPAVNRVLSSPGQSLDAQTRAFMEPRFGSNFSHVRVHSGIEAEQSAQAVGALAYTVGPNIVFGTGQYAPSNPAGRRLLAHELAHVIQQRGTSVLLQRQPKDPPDKTPPKKTPTPKPAECGYTVNYAPRGDIDCDTLYQKTQTKKPPGTLCGRGLIYDIVSVTATGKCPPFKGMRLTEEVKAEEDKARCLPPGANLVNGQGCDLEPDGTLKNCTDLYSFCGPLSDINARTNGGCQQTYSQRISIDGKEVDKHTILFEIDTTATTCSTTAKRDGKVIYPAKP